MTMLSTREEATAAAAAAVTERDTIQANLLDLDGSFGKRLLAGAKLTGDTQRQWAAVDAALTRLWETFNAYSAVVDRAAEISAGLGRSPGPKIAEITELLTGPSVHVQRPPAPLGERDLTAGPAAAVTPPTAVAEMRRSYAQASVLCAAAEAVWNQLANGLQQTGATLDTAAQQVSGIADDHLAGDLSAARADLARLREMVNTDPLSLWRNGGVDTRGLERLQQQTAALASRAAEADRVRTDATARIAALEGSLTDARSAWQDAIAARQRAAEKIAAATFEVLPDPAALAELLPGLDKLQKAGRWSRLAEQIDAVQAQIAGVTQRYRAAERAATALLDQRNELRGLLEAYKAKAGRLGGAENAQLEALHTRATDALWTAPCDLAAARAAVASYQQAVLALEASGRRP